MLNPSVAAGRPRALATIVVIASLLTMSACSSKQLAGPDSTEAVPPSTEHEDEGPSDATTSVSTSTSLAPTGDGATTTVPAAATETTASDVKRSSPFGTTTTTVTTITPTTMPPASTDAAPPATTASGCVSCAADFVFPYASFFEVPQLGAEPVRGTGCGADGTLGDIIPDGVWNARSIAISASSAAIDVQCVYHGQAGQQLLDACLAEEGPDGCENRDPNYWFVNASSRLRTMPLAASFRRRYATQDCTDPGPGNSRGTEGQDAFDSWVYIEQGEVTFALTSCLYG